MPWFSQHKDTRLLKCSEFHDPTCEQPLTSGCCAVIPCTYCLLWTPYTGDPQKGVAVFGGGWSGTVADTAFSAVWTLDYYGQCVFVVTFGAVEVYSSYCYGDISCADASDEVETQIGDMTGTLSWSKRHHANLQYVIDYDTGCRDFLCGECECTCGTLCATFVNANGCCSVTFLMSSYSCEEGSWYGSGVCDGVTYEFSVALSAGGSYGRCQISGSASGGTIDEELEVKELDTCLDWTAAFRLYDGSTLSVVCDDCDCTTIPTCNEGCCWPYEITEAYPCGYPLPVAFEITAPGCAFDGVTGEFGNTGIGDRGSCGTCLAAGAPISLGDTSGSLKVPTPGLGYCLTTPCGMDVVITLECDDDSASPYSLDPCCGKLRLWVGTSLRMAGWDGTRPSGGSSSLFWTKVAPSSCSCAGGGGGFSAIFDVTFTPDCEDGVWLDGGCIGESKCCVPVCTGFTLTI